MPLAQNLPDPYGQCMTVTDWPKPSPTTLPPNLQGVDYLRRIHWWVRLFGILWIVVPMVAAIMATVFFVVALAIGGSN